jgi:hypothetical protein
MLGSNPIIHTHLLFNQMETTETKTQSLLEIWNSDKGVENRWGGTTYPERRKLEFQLRTLLENEVEENLHYFGGGKGKAEALLAEYRSNFDWDAHYSLDINWEVEPHSATQSLDISVEEIKEYLNGEKEPECPDFSEVEDSVEGGDELTGNIFFKEVRAYITNFRPKQKQQYCVALVIDSEEEVASITEHLTNLANTSPLIQKLEVVSITPNT